MKYSITHTTRYDYSQSVSICHSEARLLPRSFGGQNCLSSDIQITPKPSNSSDRLDFFGNRITFFELQQPHTQLVVTAQSVVDIEYTGIQTDISAQENWEVLQERIKNLFLPVSLSPEENLQIRLFRLDSEMARVSDEIQEYARPSFQPGRPISAVAADLTTRIYQDFSYDPSFTTIATPLSTVMAHKRGVCQDFAHLGIACFRSFGLPARYVSGYIETAPPPGQTKLAGSDASHAWFSVYQPGVGWMDFDPTNNCSIGEQHITLAWGRDYNDIAPFKGQAIGGNQHIVSVAVDVKRMQ